MSLADAGTLLEILPEGRESGLSNAGSQCSSPRGGGLQLDVEARALGGRINRTPRNAAHRASMPEQSLLALTRQGQGGSSIHPTSDRSSKVKMSPSPYGGLGVGSERWRSPAPGPLGLSRAVSTPAKNASNSGMPSGSPTLRRAPTSFQRQNSRYNHQHTHPLQSLLARRPSSRRASSGTFGWGRTPSSTYPNQTPVHSRMPSTFRPGAVPSAVPSAQAQGKTPSHGAAPANSFTPESNPLHNMALELSSLRGGTASRTGRNTLRATGLTLSRRTHGTPGATPKNMFGDVFSAAAGKKHSDKPAGDEQADVELGGAASKDSTSQPSDAAQKQVVEDEDEEDAAPPNGGYAPLSGVRLLHPLPARPRTTPSAFSSLLSSLLSCTCSTKPRIPLDGYVRATLLPWGLAIQTEVLKDIGNARWKFTKRNGIQKERKMEFKPVEWRIQEQQQQEHQPIPHPDSTPQPPDIASPSVARSSPPPPPGSHSTPPAPASRPSLVESTVVATSSSGASSTLSAASSVASSSASAKPTPTSATFPYAFGSSSSNPPSEAGSTRCNSSAANTATATATASAASAVSPLAGPVVPPAAPPSTVRLPTAFVVNDVVSLSSRRGGGEGAEGLLLEDAPLSRSTSSSASRAGGGRNPEWNARMGVRSRAGTPSQDEPPPHPVSAASRGEVFYLPAAPPTPPFIPLPAAPPTPSSISLPAAPPTPPYIPLPARESSNGSFSLALSSSSATNLSPAMYPSKALGVAQSGPAVGGASGGGSGSVSNSPRFVLSTTSSNNDGIVLPGAPTTDEKPSFPVSASASPNRRREPEGEKPVPLTLSSSSSPNRRGMNGEEQKPLPVSISSSPNRRGMNVVISLGPDAVQPTAVPALSLLSPPLAVQAAAPPCCSPSEHDVPEAPGTAPTSQQTAAAAPAAAAPAAAAPAAAVPEQGAVHWGPAAEVLEIEPAQEEEQEDPPSLLIELIACAPLDRHGRDPLDKFLEAEAAGEGGAEGGGATVRSKEEAAEIVDRLIAWTVIDLQPLLIAHQMQAATGGPTPASPSSSTPGGRGRASPSPSPSPNPSHSRAPSSPSSGALRNQNPKSVFKQFRNLRVPLTDVELMDEQGEVHLSIQFVPAREPDPEKKNHPGANRSPTPGGKKPSTSAAGVVDGKDGSANGVVPASWIDSPSLDTTAGGGVTMSPFTPAPSSSPYPQGYFLIDLSQVVDLRDPFNTSPPSVSKLGHADWGLIRRILLAVLLYFTVGVWFYSRNEGWTLLDAIYFCIVTATTTGYGDLRVSKDSSRVFTIFFILGSIGLIAIALGIVGGLMLERQEQEIYRKMQEEVKKESSTGEGGGGGGGEEDEEDDCNGTTRSSDPSSSSFVLFRPFLACSRWLSHTFPPWLRRLAFSGFLFIVVLCTGAVGFAFLEHLDLLESVYLTVVSMGSVGYGDISPKSVGGRAFACPWIVISVLTVTRFIGEVTDIYIAFNRKQRAKAVLKSSVQKFEDLALLDDDNSGQVSELEFLKHMLVKTNAASALDIQDICEQFKTLDVDGSGFLDAQDFQRIQEQKEIQRRRPTLHNNNNNNNNNNKQ